MPVAFTENPPVYSTFTISSSAGLRAALHTTLVEAGWTTFSAITDGILYTVNSPQGLFAKVKIFDDGYDHSLMGRSVIVQFLTQDESGEGYAHRIGYEGERTYNVWANQCQIFINRPGLNDHNVGDYATNGFQWMCGGVPWAPRIAFMPPDCVTGYEGDDVAEAFWSCGSGDNGAGSAPGFRRGYRAEGFWDSSDAGVGQAFSVSVNGNTWRSSTTPVDGTSNARSSLRLVPPTPTGNFDHSWMTAPRSRDWLERPLYSDPLLAWGTDVKNTGRIRGQIWDAVLAPDHTSHALDEQFMVESVNPENGGTVGMEVLKWGHYLDPLAPEAARGSYYCSLLLRIGTPVTTGAGLGNYVY